MERLRNYIVNHSNQIIDIIATLQRTERPVCLYGGGVYASILVERFIALGIKIKAITVDKQYAEMSDGVMNSLYGIPVISIDDCRFRFENAYVIVAFNYEYDNEYSIERRAQNLFGPMADIIFIRAIWIDDIDFISTDYVMRNIVEFENTFEMLSDKMSKRIMIEYLNARISGDPRKLHLFQTDFEDDYEMDLLFANEKPGIIIECGAFDGKSAKQFAQRGSLSHLIYALEPSRHVFEELCKEVSKENDIVAVNKGVSNFVGSCFLVETRGMQHASLCNTDIEENAETVEVTTIDSLGEGKQAFLISMDIEGSELSALKGAKNTIQNNHPNLAIRVYHRKDDLITIPQYINEISQGKYKFYLRLNSVDFGAYDITLYAL